MDPDSLKFVDFLVEGGVFRILESVRKYATFVYDALSFLSENSEWANSQVLWIMFMWYEYIVYNFELYMIPFVLLVFVLFRLVASNEFDLDICGAAVPAETQENLNCVFKPAKVVDKTLSQIPLPDQTPASSDIHPLYKLQALMEMVQVAQSIVPVAKSVQAQLTRLAELVDLELISWHCCKLLTVATIWVYFIGLRYLLMAAGVYAFIKMHPGPNKMKIMLFNLITKLKFLDALPSGQSDRIKAYVQAAIDEASVGQENASSTAEALSLFGVSSLASAPDDLNLTLINDIVPTIYPDPISFTASSESKSKYE